MIQRNGPASRRAVLEQRARIIQAIRAFFVDREFLEVETPHRIPVNAPEVHIDPQPADGWQLHTSPELAMKRLLAAGYPRLFQLCRCWRQGERGRRHLPEFTLLEWYRARADYRELMRDCEMLLQALAPQGFVHWCGHTVELTSPWERLTLAEAFRRYAGVEVADCLADDSFDERLALEVEPQLGLERPVLLTDYPVELAALARRKPNVPQLAERFELYIAGVELANGFSELTDPLEQRQRFEHDESLRRRLGKPSQPLPEPFLRELERMPPAAGIALGADRLVMLLTGCDSIDQVVAFTPEAL